VDLSVREATVYGLLGPNGAGKTTAVRILTTFLCPDEGRARVAGYDVVKDAERLRHRIGLAGQSAAVDGNLTGRENLEMVGRLYHLPAEEAGRRAQVVLERFELADAADRPARTYSGGMRRRLDLGASLVGRPSVLFLDEPTTGLDPRSRLALWDVIRELVKDGTTLLLTTQYLEEADLLADRVAVVDHGRVIAEGTSDDQKAQIGGEVLQIRVVDRSVAPDAAGAVIGLVEGRARWTTARARSPCRSAGGAPAPGRGRAAARRRGHPPGRHRASPADARRGVPPADRPRDRTRTGAHDAARPPAPQPGEGRTRASSTGFGRCRCRDRRSWRAERPPICSATCSWCC
jgi:ABC-2 type transport system ATP-binding protein